MITVLILAVIVAFIIAKLKSSFKLFLICLNVIVLGLFVGLRISDTKEVAASKVKANVVASVDNVCVPSMGVKLNETFVSFITQTPITQQFPTSVEISSTFKKEGTQVQTNLTRDPPEIKDSS